MAVTKITTGDASASFSEAQSFLVNARNDRSDPVSWNLARALDSYFHAVGSAQAAMVGGINDLLERVDRIETKLNAVRR